MSPAFYSYPIRPMGKPRITAQTKFSGNARRYYAWRDQARLLNIEVPPAGSLVAFIMKMPEEWPIEKKRENVWQLHERTPDIDNMVKALLDACYADDRRVSTLLPIKVWGYEGEIRVYPNGYDVEAVKRMLGLFNC